MFTCSGFSPGGTHAYSSKAQPESSSEVEFLWKSNMSFVTVFSISRGITVTACSSCGHLQWRQIFLQITKKKVRLWVLCQPWELRYWTRDKTTSGKAPLAKPQLFSSIFLIQRVRLPWGRGEPCFHSQPWRVLGQIRWIKVLGYRTDCHLLH